MVNLENERGGHRPSQRLSTPADIRVASPDDGSLTSCTVPWRRATGVPDLRLRA